MVIKIKGVPKRAIEATTATLGDDWLLGSEKAEDPDGNLYDVLVNSTYTILKILDDKIQLDVGGIKADISQFDFRKVIIV